MRNEDEPAFKRSMVEEKKETRANKRSENEPAFKKSRAEEIKKTRGNKRNEDEVAFKKSRAEEQRETREKKMTESNSSESQRRRLFLDAVRDGPIYACVCCRRIRFRKQVKIFDSDEITENSPLETIVKDAIGNLSLIHI